MKLFDRIVRRNINAVVSDYAPNQLVTVVHDALLGKVEILNNYANEVTSDHSRIVDELYLWSVVFGVVNRLSKRAASIPTHFRRRDESGAKA